MRRAITIAGNSDFVYSRNFLGSIRISQKKFRYFPYKTVNEELCTDALAALQ